MRSSNTRFYEYFSVFQRIVLGFSLISRYNTQLFPATKLR